MRRFLLLLFLAAMAGACRAPCPDEVRLERPEDTVDTFLRAFLCDDRDREYRCFSDRVKRGFGGFAGYSIGREEFRRNRGLELALARWRDLREQVTVERLPDGRRALARIDVGEGDPVAVVLANEPAFRLFLEDGGAVEGVAQDLAVSLRPPDQVIVALYDPLLEPPDGDAVGVEIHSRWVIESLPGIEQALQAAKEQGAATP